MNLPKDHKYLEQLRKFVVITEDVLGKSRYHPDKCPEVKELLQEYIDGNYDTIVYIDTIVGMGLDQASY